MVKLRLSSLAEFASRYQSKGLLLFLLPFAFGLGAKMAHSKLWFGDYQAVACAGQKALAGHPLYDLNLACSGMHPSVYVYVPSVAQLAALCQQVIGEPGLFALYLGLFIVTLAVLMIVPLSPAIPGAWRDKVPFTVLWSGSAVMWGNIAVILHGGLLLAALAFETLPWLFVAAVAVAAWVKPVFLAYLAVVLIADRPVLNRLVMASAGMLAGLLPTLVFSLTGGELAHEWAAILSHFVYDTTPGYGYFGWLDLIGVNGSSAVVQVGYLVFAGLLMVSGLSLAEGLALNGRERLWLGLSLAVLLIPRIMSQDIFLLGPGLVVVAQKGAEWMARRTRQDTIITHGPGVILILCSIALLGGLTGQADYLTPLALFGMTLYILWLGKTVLVTRTDRVLAPLWPIIRAKPIPGE